CRPGTGAMSTTPATSHPSPIVWVRACRAPYRRRRPRPDRAAAAAVRTAAAVCPAAARPVVAVAAAAAPVGEALSNARKIIQEWRPKTLSWVADALRQSRSHRWSRAKVSAGAGADLSRRRGDRRDADAARRRARHRPLRD